MSTLGKYILERATEQSTYSGIAYAIGSASFIPNASGYAQAALLIGTCIMGLLKIFVPETTK